MLRAENQREEKTIQAILSILSRGGSPRPASPKALILSSLFLLFFPSSVISSLFLHIACTMFPHFSPLCNLLYVEKDCSVRDILHVREYCFSL